MDRDWVFGSEGVDGTTLYKLTQRGEEHYQRYTARPRRGDHICPRCGVWPRYRRESGKLNEYCRACTRQRSKERYYASRVQASNP